VERLVVIASGDLLLQWCSETDTTPAEHNDSTINTTIPTTTTNTTTIPTSTTTTTTTTTTNTTTKLMLLLILLLILLTVSPLLQTTLLGIHIAATSSQYVDNFSSSFRNAMNSSYKTDCRFMCENL
jgi:hypothetical protein